MVDIIVRDLTKAPSDAVFLKFYTFKDEEWEKVSVLIEYIKDGDGKGLALCDKCDYFVSVEEAYKNGEEDGKTDVIDEVDAIIDFIRNNAFDHSLEFDKFKAIGSSVVISLLEQLKEKK